MNPLNVGTFILFTGVAQVLAIQHISVSVPMSILKECIERSWEMMCFVFV